MYRQYKPAHSDFIIHWTGIDIDCENDKDWFKNHSSTTNSKTTEAYIRRLKGTLKYGLWMRIEKTEGEIINNYIKYERPQVARTCFTELKLSEARNHATKFGRLGIGFKRFFLFERLGAPMLYYIPYNQNWLIPPVFRSHNKTFSKEDYFSCFLKPMTIKSKDRSLEYRYFDESEWRIIYSEDIKNHFNNIGKSIYNDHFISRSSINDPDFKEYLNFSPENKWPEYLIPFKGDIWFSMIIYPSLSVKIESEADNEIRKLIEQCKPKKPKSINHLELALSEKYNKPIEINLDSCRNF